VCQNDIRHLPAAVVCALTVHVVNKSCWCPADREVWSSDAATEPVNPVPSAGGVKFVHPPPPGHVEYAVE